MLLWSHQSKLVNLNNSIKHKCQDVKSSQHFIHLWDELKNLKMHFSWLTMKKGVYTQQEGTGQEDIRNSPANLRAGHGTEQRPGMPESKRFCQTWRTQLCWSEIVRRDVKSFSTVPAKHLTEDHVSCCQIVRCEKKSHWTISALQAITVT